MGALKDKRILIFQQRGWGIGIGHFLARKLQAERCRLAALTFKKTTHSFVLNQKDVKYDLVFFGDDLMARPKEYLGGDKYSLKEICAALDVDSMWPIISSSRNLVKSYQNKYYYDYKQNVPDDFLADYAAAVYKNIKFIFDQFKPDIIITPTFGDIIHIMCNLFAQKRGIEMISVMDCKISGLNIFNYSYNGDKSPFIDRINELNKGEIDSKNREKAKQYIKEFREKFKKPMDLVAFESIAKKKISFIGKIRSELAPYKRIWHWYMKKKPRYCRIKSVGATIDYQPPRIILRDHYCQKRYKKFMENFQYYPFAKLGKFAYFPLQFQPEDTIDVTAPYFSNQLETARKIAMSLPRDYTLVVKEHPAMVGLRTPSYIEKVSRTPNVKLIDYRINSENIIKKADLIISPNSTTSAEAAFYYKPAIQLGNLGTTLRLPNVFKHTDMTTLSSKIKDLVALDLKNKEYERRLENYVAAVFDVGFEFNYFGVWEYQENEDMKILWHAWKNEIEKVLNNF